MRSPKGMSVCFARATVLIFSLIFFGASFSFADEIEIPFSVYVDSFRADAKVAGFDLYDGDGFVENKGQRFVVYTYKPVTETQLELIKELTWKNLRK